MASSTPTPTPTPGVQNSVSSSNPSVSTTSNKKKLPKNAAGSKSDPGWKYGVSLSEDNRTIQCTFCQKIVKGSIYRLKHHLGGTSKDVGHCPFVTDDVKKEMLTNCSKLQQALINRTKIPEEEEEEEEVEEVVSIGTKRVSKEPATRSGVALFKRRNTVQTTINSVFKKNIREEACLAIGEFFVNNAIPFNCARSEEYKKMWDLAIKHGQGFEPPSYYELRVRFLQKMVNLTNERLEEHRAEWRKNGCTLMTDGWTDRRRRSILNFLVNSPKGTVFLKSIDASHISKTGEVIFKMLDEMVEQIGAENVVQVVTDNASNCVLAGELLMKKHPQLYWTPCAAHSIDLMLEDLMKIPYHASTIPKGKKITKFIYQRTSLISILQQHTSEIELVRPSATRFATSYLTLGCLHEHKDCLIRMFTSKEWKANRNAKTKNGKEVEGIVLDINGFWKDVLNCLKGAGPIVKVLRLVDSDQKPAMGFVYEAMYRSKEEIRANFKNIKKRYEPYWELIDARWNKMLNKPLHAAAYFLNPQRQYGPNFKDDTEVRKGLLDVMHRLVPDKVLRAKIDRQMDDFKKRRGYFGCDMARINLDKKDPADWWDSYGIEYPELQSFAIRILSLTASSSGCERNWSAFEMVHTKRRNRLKAKTMNDVVFVMVNSKLRRKKKVRREHEIEDLISDSEWVSGDEGDVVDVEDVVGLDEVSEEDVPDDCDPNYRTIEMEQTPNFEYVHVDPNVDGDVLGKGKEVDVSGEDEVDGVGVEVDVGGEDVDDEATESDEDVGGVDGDVGVGVGEDEDDGDDASKYL